MSYLQTPKSHYNPSLTQYQLEEITRSDRSAGKREQSAFAACELEPKTPEDREMDDLSESWDWFGKVLDQAQDEDYRPVASVPKAGKPVSRTTPIPPRLSSSASLRWERWGAVSAAIALVSVLGLQFWYLSDIVHQNGGQNHSNNAPIVASVQPNPKVEAIAAANNAQAVHDKTQSVSDLPDSLFVWEDEETFDDDLTRLSESFANYIPGDNWSTSVACSYQSLDESFESWQEDNSGF